MWLSAILSCRERRYKPRVYCSENCSTPTYTHIYLYICTSIYYIPLPPPTPHGWTAPSGPGPPQYRFFTITLRHAILGRAPLHQWSAWLREFYLPTPNTQKTDINDPGGIRTHNPCKPAAADWSLRPRGHWNRYIYYIIQAIVLVLIHFSLKPVNNHLKFGRRFVGCFV